LANPANGRAVREHSSQGAAARHDEIDMRNRPDRGRRGLEQTRRGRAHGNDSAFRERSRHSAILLRCCGRAVKSAFRNRDGRLLTATASDRFGRVVVFQTGVYGTDARSITIAGIGAIVTTTGCGSPTPSGRSNDRAAHDP